MNLTANIGLGRSMGAAFLILPLGNQPEWREPKFRNIPSVCSLPNGLRHNPERQFAGQRCQLRVSYHVMSLTVREGLHSTPKFHGIRMSVISDMSLCTAINASNVERCVAYTSCFMKTDSRKIHLIKNRLELSALSPALELVAMRHRLLTPVG